MTSTNTDLTELRELADRVQGWLLSRAPRFLFEVRSAVADLRRSPRLAAASVLVTLWALTGFSTAPLIVGAVVLVVSLIAVFLLGVVLSYRAQRSLRRYGRVAAVLAACVALLLSVPPLGWLALVVLSGALVHFTAVPRGRKRLIWAITSNLTGQLGLKPGALRVESADWRGRELVSAVVLFGPELRPAEPGRRERVQQVVGYLLRWSGSYRATFAEGRNAFVIGREPELPLYLDEQDWPEGCPGVPLGVTDADTVDVVLRDPDAQLPELYLAVHVPSDERDLLVVGVKGSGKTVFARHYIASGLKVGMWADGVHMFDGKSSGDYAPLEGCVGVVELAREPVQWATSLRALMVLMKERYEADYQWQASGGTIPRPTFKDKLIVLDEIQAILSALPKAEGEEIVRAFGRMARGARFRFMVLTQRPDAKDAVPGDLKDQLEDRIVCGFLSPIGAGMALDKDAHLVEESYGAEWPRGRVIARIKGQIKRIQVPFLDAPLKTPSHAKFYPPKRAGYQHPQPIVNPPTTRPENGQGGNEPTNRPMNSGRRQRRKSE